VGAEVQRATVWNGRHCLPEASYVFIQFFAEKKVCLLRCTGNAAQSIFTAAAF